MIIRGIRNSESYKLELNVKIKISNIPFSIVPNTLPNYEFTKN